VVQGTEAFRPKPRSAGVRRKSPLNRGLRGGPKNGKRPGSATRIKRHSSPRANPHPFQSSIAIRGQAMINSPHRGVFARCCCEGPSMSTIHLIQKLRS
jgi:hypothetical protein